MTSTRVCKRSLSVEGPNTAIVRTKQIGGRSNGSASYYADENARKSLQPSTSPAVRSAEMIRIIVAGAVLVAAVLCAPLAQADGIGDQLYLKSIHEEYFARTHTDAEWLAEAHKVCDAHRNGTHGDQLVDMVRADLNLPDNVVAATVIGAAAGSYDC